MQSTRIINQTGGAIAALFTLAIGCNSIVGLDKISIDAAQPADSAGASGAHMGGAGNAGGGVQSQAGSANVAGGGSSELLRPEAKAARPTPKSVIARPIKNAPIAHPQASWAPQARARKRSPRCA